MAKVNDLSPEKREKLREEVNAHAETLRSQLVASGDYARNYLTLTNGGAAVALLAYMNARPAARASTLAWVCLGIFALGIVFVGVLAAVHHYARRRVFDTWQQAATKFFRDGSITLEQLYETASSQKNRIADLPVVAGYLAFLCFIVGSVVAVTGLIGTYATTTAEGYQVTGGAPWCSVDDNGKAISCVYYSERHCATMTSFAPFCVPRPE